MSEGVRGEPWWASGAGPGDGLHDEDPLDRHRAGRRGTSDGRAPREDPVDAHADGRVCHACPVCITLRALESSRPEVVGHLADALHHLSLAARAFMEAQVGATGGDGGLRRVDLDDE